jgi:hypothetical protein
MPLLHKIAGLELSDVRITLTGTISASISIDQISSIIKSIIDLVYYRTSDRALFVFSPFSKNQEGQILPAYIPHPFDTKISNFFSPALTSTRRMSKIILGDLQSPQESLLNGR